MCSGRHLLPACGFAAPPARACEGSLGAPLSCSFSSPFSPPPSPQPPILMLWFGELVWVTRATLCIPPTFQALPSSPPPPPPRRWMDACYRPTKSAPPHPSRPHVEYRQPMTVRRLPAAAADHGGTSPSAATVGGCRCSRFRGCPRRRRLNALFSSLDAATDGCSPTSTHFAAWPHLRRVWLGEGARSAAGASHYTSEARRAHKRSQRRTWRQKSQ